MSRDEAIAFIMELYSILFMRHNLGTYNVEFRTIEYNEATDKTVVSEAETRTVDTTGKWQSEITIKLPV